jgi:hypothetical protein
MTQKTDTWNEVEDAVNNHDGVVVVTMETLRDIAGYGRLGSAVRQTIVKRLNDMGIHPISNGDLPNDAHANVIIYKEGTPAGDIIDLVTSVAQGGRATETTANELRKLNKGVNTIGVRKALESALNMLDK